MVINLDHYFKSITLEGMPQKICRRLKAERRFTLK
jgi:hypothetical protein